MGDLKVSWVIPESVELVVCGRPRKSGEAGVSVGHSFRESGVVGLAECRWVVGVCWFDRTGCRKGC